MDIKVMSFNPYDSRYFYVDNTFALFIKEKDKNVPYFAALINDITKCQQFTCKVLKIKKQKLKQ